MFRQVAHPRSANRPRLGAVRRYGERTTWLRPISVRADSKLSPCMARPNLFSGD